MIYVKHAVIGFILASEFMKKQLPSSFQASHTGIDLGLINISERDVSGSFTGHHGGPLDERAGDSARSKREMLEYRAFSVLISH